MNARQKEFIRDAFRQKNAEELNKILELEFLDNINGTEIKKDGKLHSPVINGELIPSIIHYDGSKRYYNNGNFHSFVHNGELIPAYILPNERKEYYNNGQYHSFFHNGELIPAIIHKNGRKSYYNNGHPHSFVHNGELIPAIINPDGSKSYYNNGTKVGSAERMQEIIAEKLLEVKEDKLVAVLKLLA